MASIIGGIVEGVLGIANKYIADPAERDKFATDMAQLQIQQEQTQTDTNKVEAASANLFVAGWRPFVGWTCGGALAYHFIIQPLLAFTFSALGHPIILPDFDMTDLNTILMGMLGLGSMRSLEKIKGVA